MSQRQTISDLAYQLWVARGRPEGSSHVDWLEAERQVTGGAIATVPATAPAHQAASAQEPGPVLEPVPEPVKASKSRASSKRAPRARTTKTKGPPIEK